MDNLTLGIIDHDIYFDDNADIAMISGAETVAQCVRMTLETFRGEWFLDLDHGTDYDQIIGDGTGDPEAIIRAAIFEETAVQYIDALTVTKNGRAIMVSLTGRLNNGAAINLEVTA